MLTTITISDVILKRVKHIYGAFKIRLKVAAYILAFKHFLYRETFWKPLRDFSVRYQVLNGMGVLTVLGLY
jgi:hypothetical protein